jgi:hypothetical protein
MTDEWCIGKDVEGSGRGLILRYFPAGTEENHENLSQDSRSPGRNLNLGPPKYEAGLLTTRPWRSVVDDGMMMGDGWLREGVSEWVDEWMYQWYGHMNNARKEEHSQTRWYSRRTSRKHMTSAQNVKYDGLRGQLQLTYRSHIFPLCSHKFPKSHTRFTMQLQM